MKNYKDNNSTKSIIPDLKNILGEDQVFLDIEDLIVYSFDASGPRNDQRPLCIVSPGNRDEIVSIVNLANKYKIPVIPRGSGTGLAGATVPVPNSIILLTHRLNRIIEIDEENLTALIEPGVITADLAKKVEMVGLFYPPDPGSMAVSTLGGNIALDSGGLRGLKYGVTRDYVMGLEVVLPTGDILYTGGKCKKDAAGYHLTSLFVGSEGTLGIITQALLRLIPLPAEKRTAVAFFTDIQPAADVVAKIISEKIIPVTLEILDKISLRCINEYAQLGLPNDAGAMLLIEVDGFQFQVDEEIELIAAICKQNGATTVEIAQNDEQSEKLKFARRTTLAALARQKPTTVIEDVTVPRNKIPEMVKRIRQIADKYKIDMAIFGHAGDGNLHPTAMVDSRDSHEMEMVEIVFDLIFQAAIDLGGTITGEHGVGLKKRHVLQDKVGEVGMATMKGIKKSLDPNNIMNPDKIFKL